MGTTFCVLITDPSAQDDDSSSEPQVEVESGNLSECEDPSESDDDDDGDVEDDNDSDDNDDDDDGDDDGGDHGDDDDDGSKEGTGYFSVKTAIRRKKLPSESDMELDLNILNKQPQSESDTDMNLEQPKISSTQTQSEGETDAVDEGEGNPQPMTSKKRKRIDQTSSFHEPQPKQQKTGFDHELISKTARALEHVLGTCEEVLKYDKLKQNVAKNPKSRYHIEHYETHLTKIQILILKAYKKIFNDIKTWKENFTLSMQGRQLKMTSQDCFRAAQSMEDYSSPSLT